MGEAIKEPVGGTSHVFHLKVGMGKGWAEEKDTFSHSGRLETGLLLQPNSLRGSQYVVHI